MSRPKVDETRKRAPKLLTMAPESWAHLDALCAERGLSRGRLVEALLRAAANDND